jgi:subtilisin family serine protease
LLIAWILGLALALPVAGSTQPAPATFPVIVVFRDDAPFASFGRYFREDDRVRAHPLAWAYVDRGVVGLMQALEAGYRFRAEHVFSATVRGFAARLTSGQIQALESDPDVAYVEPDGTMTISAQTLPWGIDRIGADTSSTLAGNGGGTVTGVNVYIIDTGIDTSHTDLTVVGHVKFTGWFGGSNKDCHGHGTHVAGTAAAKDNTADVVGAAAGARLTGVKVLGCNGSGSTSGVIKGVDWVTANAVKPAVANMSLGGSASTALDDAVRRSAASGVFYAIAAGNSGADACLSSPARAGAGDNGIMTVAATDSSDQEASWSNYGPCVDVWAPGVNILSTKRGGGTTTMSGTSMASPHAAGTAALYLNLVGNLDPAEVETALKAGAVPTGTLSKGSEAITLIYAGAY